MLHTYYTLRALAEAWRPLLTGCILGDAFSQVRGEVTLAWAHPERETMLRIATQPPFLYAFRSDGFSKARRNVATIFESAFDQKVSNVRCADRDRVLFLDFEDGGCFQVLLFGSRANVLLVDADGRIVEAFKDDETLVGTTAPSPRPAPVVDTFAAFEERWDTKRNTTVQALTRALPLFDKTLAAEALFRAGVSVDQPPGLVQEDTKQRLFEAAQTIEAELMVPAPHIYWRGKFAETLALCPFHHLEADAAFRSETFDTLDEAVRTFVRRTLGQRRFKELYEPLERTLKKAHQDDQRRVERMLEELANESRADRYEHWGHLLMASPKAVPAGSDEVTLPDLFADTNEPVTIPLNPAQSAIENAQRFYDKARRTRRAREEAEARIFTTEARAEAAEMLLQELQQQEFLSDLQRFMKDNADRLAPFTGTGPGQQDRVPFRRYDLGGGYEVWVGRNARQNDDLTFHHAQKYDLWMHARGVAGSHAVLRLPNRNAQPQPFILERAASIAAYYSKARGSSLVPVIVAPRKFVRKPRGAAPGAVLVEREEVVMVEPGVPEG